MKPFALAGIPDQEVKDNLKGKAMFLIFDDKTEELAEKLGLI